MQKISPLRSGIAAFNKFRNQKPAQNQTTNPFAAIKEKALEMDVFETSSKTGESKFVSFCSSTLQNAKNQYNALKQNTVSFASGLKENAISFTSNLKENAASNLKKMQQALNTKIDFNFFKYNVSSLKNQPVAELRTMLVNELKGI